MMNASSFSKSVSSTTITGFHEDEHGDFVAKLACGHSQHMRHRPPFQTRPWVMSTEGRAEKIGTPIECSLCDMPALPDAGAPYEVYKRTATFSESTVPSGLLRDHGTKPGVYARIVVEAGELQYRLESPVRTFVLTPERPGIVPPAAPHSVKPLGEVRFHVEFLRRRGP